MEIIIFQYLPKGELRLDKVKDLTFYLLHFVLYSIQFAVEKLMTAFLCVEVNFRKLFKNQDQLEKLLDIIQFSFERHYLSRYIFPVDVLILHILQMEVMAI